MLRPERAKEAWYARPSRRSLGLVLCWCTLARAQGIPVYDNTNFFQNLITAVQSTLTAVSSAQTAASFLLDLTPLDEIIMASSGLLESISRTRW